MIRILLFSSFQKVTEVIEASTEQGGVPPTTSIA
jgi:hypothetical protein